MKLLVILCLINVVLSDYKFTEEIISKCKKYVSNQGYNYGSYFKVHSGHLSPGIKFELHLAIKAKNNGHILLSSTESASMTDPVYELTVGAGGNTFTELRRMRMKEGKSTADTEKLLKEDEYVPFWIKAHDDGLVEFGKEGDDEPLVSYFDPFPLNINYFSFTSWKGIKATFLYDCPIAGNFTDLSEEVMKNLTTAEKLRKDLLFTYDPLISPVSLSSANIKLSLEYSLKSISFDIKKSVLTTHGMLKAQWIDDNLQWYPSEYGNISSETFNSKQIWTPEIKIYDSLDMNYVNWSNIPIFCNSEGTVLLSTSFTSRTWCSPKNNVMHWPHDVHTCFLRLGSWSQSSQINITSDEKLKDVPIFALRNEFHATEWKLLQLITSSNWTNYSPYVQMLENMDSDLNTLNTLNIKFVIKRINASYGATLYSPFLCVALIVMMTFWLSTPPSTKLTILCIELIFVMAFAVQVLDQIPSYVQNFPNIVIGYFWAIVVIWISIIINALTEKLSIDSHPWMRNVIKFLTDFNIITCMTFSNIKVDKSYKSHDADEEEKDEEQEDEIEWRAFGVAIDRIVFAVLTVIFGLYTCFR